MPDDFCISHGYEHMRCDKHWGAIPYCTACDQEREKSAPDLMKLHDETIKKLKRWIET